MVHFVAVVFLLIAGTPAVAQLARPFSPCSCAEVKDLKDELASAKRLQQNFRAFRDSMKGQTLEQSQNEFNAFVNGNGVGRSGQVSGGLTPGSITSYTFSPYGDRVDPGLLGPNTAARNEQLCEFTSNGKADLERYARSGAACKAIGDATIAHEELHRSQCVKLGYRRWKLELSGSQMAQTEIDAYQVQIDMLQREIDRLDCKYGGTIWFRTTWDAFGDGTEGRLTQEGKIATQLQQNPRSPQRYEASLAVDFTVNYEHPRWRCEASKLSGVPVDLSVDVVPENDPDRPKRLIFALGGTYDATTTCCEGKDCWEQVVSSSVGIGLCAGQKLPTWMDSASLSGAIEYRCELGHGGFVDTVLKWNLQLQPQPKPAVNTPFSRDAAPITTVGIPAAP